jgi:hypothetical protein
MLEIEADDRILQVLINPTVAVDVGMIERLQRGKAPHA